MTVIDASAARSTIPTPWHLQDNYAPVMTEIEAFDLGVRGRIPGELDGLYVRNGANPATGARFTGFLVTGCCTGPA